MATNFVVTNLADWIAANPQKAVEIVILSGKGTKDYFDIESGVKYKTKIPYASAVSTDVSTGPIAGYKTGSGTTTIKDVTLQNTQLNIFETYTKEQIDKTILGPLAKKGTDPSELPVEELVLSLKSKDLFRLNEYYMWQDASTLLLDGGGILQQIIDASTYKPSDFGDTDLTTLIDASVVQYVNAMNTELVQNFPELIGEETILAMSPGNFSAYSRAVYSLNGTVSTLTVGADGKPIVETYLPGTNVKAVSMIGLNGSNAMVLCEPKNIIQVVDLVGEDEFVEFIYNPYARWHELAVQYKLGVKVVDPVRVVMTK